MHTALETGQKTQQISALLTKYDNATSRGQAFRRAAANNKATPEELQSDLEILFTQEVLNEKDKNPLKLRTALHQAVINGSKPAIKFLLEKNALYNIKDAEHCTAIHYAAQSNDPEVKQLILARLEKDNPPQQGKSLLHLAVEKQDRKMVELLLKLGADYNRIDSNGETPICYLSKINDDEIKKLIILKLVNAILQKIYPKYKNAGDDERIAELTLFRKIKTLWEKKQETTTILIQFILTALLKNSAANGTLVDIKNVKEKTEEYMSLVNLIATFAGYDDWKSIYDLYKTLNKNQPLLNYCGLLCHDLIYALLLHPAFLNHKILFFSLYTENAMGTGNHETIIINGELTDIKTSTILCNPLRMKIYHGPVEIDQYIGDTKPDVCPHNKIPMLKFFRTDKEIYETFLSQVKQAFLQSIEKPANQPIIKQFLIEKARNIMTEQPEVAKRIFDNSRNKVGSLLEDTIKGLLKENKPMTVPLVINSQEAQQPQHDATHEVPRSARSTP